jgi:hydroxymethylglutaryl-CoA synthase
VEPVTIAAVAGYVPSARLDRAAVAEAWGRHPVAGQVAVCPHDEDTLTMAHAAADAALASDPEPVDPEPVDPEPVDGLFWGTTAAPFAEGPNHALLREALGLPATCHGAVHTGSAHAGMDALLAAWDAIAAGACRRALVVCSDEPGAGLGTAWEERAGAAAAAAVLTRGAGPARLIGRATWSAAHLDRYRGAAEPATRDLYDPRLSRERHLVPAAAAVAASLARPLAADAAAGTENAAAGTADAEIIWILPDHDGRPPAALRRAVGATALAAPPDGVGAAGAAGALLTAVTALERPGRLAILANGGGRTTAVAARVETPPPGAGPLPRDGGAVTMTYPEALRARGRLVADAEPVPMAVPPGSAAFTRGGREILQLLAVRCDKCGTLATPPSVHPRCLACGVAVSSVVPLGRHGRVHTFVVNHTMPAPFVAPLPLAVVDLDGGGRIMLQVTGPAADLAVGERVDLVLRRYARERGVPVYGYMARRVEPVGEGSAPWRGTG